MDDRFLSSSDAVFVELVEEDLNRFIQEYSGSEKSVLLFPPVSSYHRFLIHSTAQNYTRLHSFSVGAGYNRRTTVCLKQDLIRDPKDCSGLMSAQQPPSSRGRGRGRYGAGGSPSPYTTTRRPEDTDVRVQEQGSGHDCPRVERHPQSLRNRKKRPEVQLYVPRGRRQQLAADQTKTNEHASVPTESTNQDVGRPVSYQPTSCPEDSPDRKYTSAKFKEEKSRNDSKNLGQYSTERNDSSNLNTSEYTQQQCSSRLLDCNPPKQRRAGRGTANRKSKLKNEVYVPPGRRNRDSSCSISNSSAVDDTKGQFEDVCLKQESEINVEVKASLCSKHSDAKKSRFSRTVRESGLSDSELCNSDENYSDDRGASLEESSEVSLDKQSTSISSRNIECTASVQSQKCVIPQKVKQHSVDPSQWTCTPYDSIEDTNSHSCIIDNLPQIGASHSGVTHNSELLDKKQPKNTDPLRQDIDAVPVNSMQVNQLSGQKSASYSENIDKTEEEFKTESQKVLTNHENWEEDICEARTNSVNKSAIENLPASVGDQHTETPADDPSVQDHTETQADDISVRDHTEIPPDDISVQDHTEIQADDASVQAHTETPADDISVQDHTEIPADDISVQGHAETPVENISVQDGEKDVEIDLQTETEIKVCISDKNVDDSVKGNIMAAHINKKDSHVDDEQESKVSAGSEKMEDEETTCDKSDDIEEEDDEDSWDKMFDEEGECLDPKAMEELTSAIGKVKIKKPTINYLNYQPRDPDMDYDDMSHVIEIFDFPPELKTEDLLTAFHHFSAKGIDIKWVDDTHALGVFNSPIAAKDALTLKHPLLKVGPLSNASRQCKVKAKRCVEFLQPYKPRPETSAVTARRLVTGALGLLPRVSKEQRDAERQKLKQARDKKKLVKKQKEDIWEGNYTSSENME